MEKERFPYSLDEIDAVLAGDDENKLRELWQLLEARGMSAEDFELSRAARRLRRETLDQMRVDLRQRIETNPVATEEEHAFGTFLESLEPQVRDALCVLRQKGYAAVSSGFSNYNFQAISFSENYFADLDSSVRAQLEDLSVKVEGDRLSFCCNIIDLDVIKQKWDAVAAALPDRGVPAPPSEHPAAINFREIRLDKAGRLKPEWKKHYLR